MLGAAPALTDAQRAAIDKALPGATARCALNPCELSVDFKGDGHPLTPVWVVDQDRRRHLGILSSADFTDVEWSGAPLSLQEECSSASCLTGWKVIRHDSPGFRKLPKPTRRAAKGDLLELTWSDDAGIAYVFFDGTGFRKFWAGGD